MFQAVEFRIAPHHAILKAILRIALTIKERRAGDRLGAKSEAVDLRRELLLSADTGHRIGRDKAVVFNPKPSFVGRRRRYVP